MEWNGQRLIVLPREHTDHSKHPLPTIQEKTLHMDITRWSTLESDWLYSLQPKDGEILYSQQKQDRELTVAQIMNSLLLNSDLNWRKVGKTTRPLSSVQSLSRVQLVATPWIAARQASLSITNSRRPLKPMSIESVMPPTIYSVMPFSSCPQSFPASGSFQMTQLFTGGQSIGVSASTSVLPMNT